MAAERSGSAIKPGWPCTLREAGLLGDRPLWKSRAGIAVIVFAAALTLESLLLVWRAAAWAHVPMRSIPYLMAETARLNTTLLNLLTVASQALSVLALLMPVGLSALAWTHDTNPANRDQLRLLPLDHSDLRHSRFQLWLLIWFAANAIAVVLAHALVRLPQLYAGPHSTLWFVTAHSGFPSKELLISIMPLSWFGAVLQFSTNPGVGLGLILFELLWAVALFGWVSLLTPHIGATFGAALPIVVGIALPLPPLLERFDLWGWWIPGEPAAIRWVLWFVGTGCLAAAVVERRLQRWYPEASTPSFPERSESEENPREMPATLPDDRKRRSPRPGSP